MRKTILLAFALVAFVAMPAMASVQNVKISGSIDSTWLVRNNFDLGLNNIGDETQNLFITQSILQADADLTDNVSTTIALINERVWGDAGTPNTVDSSTTVDLLLAYVTLREMLYSPLTVVVGKQAFHYGNSFIVDSGGTNTAAPADSSLQVAGDLTKQTTQDAFRFIFDYEPLSIEVLASKINARTNTMTVDDNDDIDLYGVNAGYEVGDSMNTQVEAYFFARIDKLNTTAAAGEFSKADTVYVPGLRASTNPIEGLNVQLELAWQRGNRVATTGTIRDNEQREAMGAQFIGSYQVPVLEEYKPILQYVYTYVSGDTNPDDRAVTGAGNQQQGSTNKFTAWDPLFENQAGGTIYNTLFNLSNAHIHAVSAQVNPIEDVTTKVTWTNMRLDKELRTGQSFAILQPDGAGTAATGFKAGEDDIGNEIDLTATYDYTEDVQFGANLGWFIPGDLFADAAGGVLGAHAEHVATQAIIHGNVNF